MPSQMFLTVWGEGQEREAKLSPRQYRSQHLASTSRHNVELSSSAVSHGRRSPWSHVPLPSVCQLGSLLAGAGPAECQTSADRIFKQLSQSSELLWSHPSAQLWGAGLFSSATSSGVLESTLDLDSEAWVGSQPCDFIAK